MSTVLPTLFRAIVLIVFLDNLTLSAATALKATPVSLSFSYQNGLSTLPAAQTVSIAVLTAGAASTGVSVVTAGGLWLTATPALGTTTLAVSVAVNPTGLSVGAYAGSVIVTPAGGTVADAVTIPVTLRVQESPPGLVLSPPSIALTYRRGDPYPLQQVINMISTGSALSYTLAVGGGTWLTVNSTSGAIFPAFPVPLTVTIDPSALLPGTYTSTITITVPASAAKTVAFAISLTVQPGVPAISTIWPDNATIGANDQTVTLQGANFYSGSVVKASGTALKSKLIAGTVMTVVVPAAMMIAAAVLPITVSNPNPGGGDSAAGPQFTVLPPGPRISTIVNAASYQANAVAPGEVVVIYGAQLGPASLTTFVTGGPTVANSLAGVQVLFDQTPAPLLYVWNSQLAAVVPYMDNGKIFSAVTVNYNSTVSNVYPLQVQPTSPGIFTFTGNGVGQGAAFNFDSASQTYTLNSGTNAAARGTSIAFFSTGQGNLNPPVPDGTIATAGGTVIDPNVSVTIGGQPANVLYTGPVPGLSVGILQVNVTVPSSIAIGTGIPIVLMIAGKTSQDGVTIGVK